METRVSKSNFKAHALEIMRNIEETGKNVVITSHGTPCLLIKEYHPSGKRPLEQLKGTVVVESYFYS